MGVVCAKCKKTYEEIELMWIIVDGRMKLLCDNCARKRK